jgi:hypothetical protein
MGLSTIATLNSAADSIDVIRQFVKDIEFIWPESPKDEDKIAKDIAGIIESWDLGEQAEGCFKYVNYGIVVATVSLLHLLWPLLEKNSSRLLHLLQYFYGHVPNYEVRVLLGAITA